ncbi:hypothetical protein BpHYR1_029451, partial [Brachionus plicatilis]
IIFCSKSNLNFFHSNSTKTFLYLDNYRKLVFTTLRVKAKTSAFTLIEIVFYSIWQKMGFFIFFKFFSKNSIFGHIEVKAEVLALTLRVVNTSLRFCYRKIMLIALRKLPSLNSKSNTIFDFQHHILPIHKDISILLPITGKLDFKRHNIGFFLNFFPFKHSFGTK